MSWQVFKRITNNHDLLYAQQQAKIFQDEDTCKNVYETHSLTSSWFISVNFLCKLLYQTMPRQKELPHRILKWSWSKVLY